MKYLERKCREIRIRKIIKAINRSNKSNLYNIDFMTHLQELTLNILYFLDTENSLLIELHPRE